MEDRDGPTSVSVSDEELPVFTLTAQEQEEVLRACHPEIKNMLDYDQIFPYLNRHRLLTSSDQEELDTLPRRGQKIDWLVRSLPRKGSEAVWKFLDSLKCTVDGTAHGELLSLLQEQVNNVKEIRNTMIGTRGVLPWIKRRMVIVLIALLLLAALSLVWPHKSTLLSAARYHFNLHIRSKSLPYPTEHFVGREKEMDEIAQLVSCDNADDRLVSIVGPPGIGKTTIAVRVGHMMVQRGVSVYYVDMVEVSSMQALAEKVLASADTLISTKNVTVERLMKWAGDLQYFTVLILDNCDDTLREQEDSLRSVVKRLLKSSGDLKVLMTSRQSTSQVGMFQRYILHELSLDDSCSLLQTVAKMTHTECEKIAHLTGNVPLALQVVGALLSQPNSPEPMVVVAQLKEKLISTLSPEELPPEVRVNVSINLSYQFLDHRLQKIGRYLANFPGSFDRDSACAILQSIAENPITCDYISRSVDQLVRQSLLEFSYRGSRFQFHNLIRQFFLDIQHLVRPSEARLFLLQFQLYFSGQLRHLNGLYKTDHMQALAELDVERHNIHHLLSTVAVISASLDLTQYLSIVVDVQQAIESSYLNCRFTVDELEMPLRAMVDHLSMYLNVITALNASPKMESFVKVCVFLLVRSDLTLLGLREQSQNLSIKMLNDHLSILEREDIVSVASRYAAREYIMMYQKLSNYYKGNNDAHHLKECHAKILKVTDRLTECEPAMCSYEHIGEAYLHAESYEEGAYFLELARQELDHDPFVRLSMLYKLWTANFHLDNFTKAEANLDEMIALSPQLMNSPASILYQHAILLQIIVRIYKIYDRIDEAIFLEEKQVEAIREIGAKTSVAEEVKELVEHIFKEGNYSKVADLAQFGRESMKHLSPSQQQASTGLRLDLEILIGRAKFHAGNYSEGLDRLELVMDNLDELGPSTYPERYKTVCSYVWIRLRVGCFKDHVVYPLLYAGASILYTVFGVLLDPSVTASVYRHARFPSPPMVGKPSSTTALVGTEDTQDALALYHFFGVPQLQLESWLEFLFAWFGFYLEYGFMLVIRSAVWTVQFSLVRFAVNLVWVYIKLMLVVYTYKCIQYCMSCFYSLVIMFIRQLTLLRIQLLNMASCLFSVFVACMYSSYGPLGPSSTVIYLCMCNIIICLCFYVFIQFLVSI